MSTELIETKALILRHEPWRQRDRRLLIFGKDLGLSWAVVRGIRRPQAKLVSILDGGMLTSIQLVRKHGHLVVTRGELLNGYPRFRLQPAKGVTLQLISRLLEETQSGRPPETELWRELKTLINYCHRLAEEDGHTLRKGLRVILVSFLAMLLRFGGYTPELQTCRAVGRRHAGSVSYYYPAGGGVVCARHALKDRVIPVTAVARQALAVLFLPSPNLSRLNTKVASASLLALVEKIIWATAFYHLELTEDLIIPPLAYFSPIAQSLTILHHDEHS